MNTEQTTQEPASPPLPEPTGSVWDATRSALPPKDPHQLAEDLLARFPGVDRAELLEDMVAWCFAEKRYGNKRQERAACDFLNEVQRIAIRNTNTPNA